MQRQSKMITPYIIILTMKQTLPYIFVCFVHDDESTFELLLDDLSDLEQLPTSEWSPTECTSPIQSSFTGPLVQLFSFLLLMCQVIFRLLDPAMNVLFSFFALSLTVMIRTFFFHHNPSFQSFLKLLQQLVVANQVKSLSILMSVAGPVIPHMSGMTVSTSSIVA